MTFTDRELEVLKVVRAGARTHLRIAQLLKPAVSESTAEMHVRNIAEKLREDPKYQDGGPMVVVQIYANASTEAASS